MAESGLLNMRARAEAIRLAVPRLASDTLWYSAAGTVGKGLALLSVPFLTRALGPDDYGLVDLATATVGLMTIVAMFAGDIPTARLVAFAATSDGRRRRYTEYIIAVSALSLTIGFAVMLAAGPIATVVWSSPGAEPLVLLAATLIPITSVRAAIATLHRLEGNSRRFAMLATLDVVAQLVLGVALVWLGFGAYGAVAGFVAGGTLALVVTVALSYQLVGPGSELRAVPALIARGAPLLPPLVAFIAADFVARAMVADSLGQASVGELALALRIASVLALLTAAFQLAWSPQAAGSTFGPETSERFGRILLGYVVSAGLACIVLVSAAPEVVQLIAGGAFDGATAVLPGLAFAAVLAGTHFILSMGSVVYGGTWMVAASSVGGATLQVLVIGIFIGSFGLWAVGLGAVAGRAASVTLLGPRVAPAFGRRLLSTSAVLLGVGSTCILIGLSTNPTNESLPIRVLIAIGATAAMVSFVVRFVGSRNTVTARRAPS